MIRAAKLAPYAAALALSCAAAAALPSPVFAQPVAPQAERQDRPSRVEGRIAFLRTELQITDAQAQLWDAVANALRENDRTMRESLAQRPARDASITAIERLERRQKFAELQVASTARLRNALTPLYAAMSDVQKKNADQLLAGPPHGRMGHRRI
jgi:LTXXQ motif family protein